MKSRQVALVVTWLCIALCLVCLGLAIFCTATGRSKEAFLPMGLLLVILRLNAWYLRRQRLRSQTAEADAA